MAWEDNIVGVCLVGGQSFPYDRVSHTSGRRIAEKYTLAGNVIDQDLGKASQIYTIDGYYALWTDSFTGQRIDDPYGEYRKLEEIANRGDTVTFIHASFGETRNARIASLRAIVEDKIGGFIKFTIVVKLNEADPFQAVDTGTQVVEQIVEQRRLSQQVVVEEAMGFENPTVLEGAQSWVDDFLTDFDSDNFAEFDAAIEFAESNISAADRLRNAVYSPFNRVEGGVLDVLDIHSNVQRILGSITNPINGISTLLRTLTRANSNPVSLLGIRTDNPAPVVSAENTRNSTAFNCASGSLAAARIAEMLTESELREIFNNREEARTRVDEVLAAIETLGSNYRAKGNLELAAATDRLQTAVQNHTDAQLPRLNELNTIRTSSTRDALSVHYQFNGDDNYLETFRRNNVISPFAMPDEIEVADV